MRKYEELANQIINNVGGKENINTLGHCVTRLRFNLKDESKANDDVLRNMDGVITVMKAGGQYQVVIGNHVPEVYKLVNELAGISENNEEVEVKGNLFNKLIDIVSGCFQPFLGAMAAAGMIKGLNALLIFLKVYTNTSGTYLMLNAIGDSVFFFMPVIVGYTSAKKLRLNPMVGMLIGASLCYPNIQAGALQGAFESLAGEGAAAPFSLLGADAYTTFFGIPWVAGNYTSSVLPVIFIVAFAAQIQKVSKKIIPEVIQNFFVPFLTLLISLPIGFLVIGPVINVLTNLLSTGFTSLMSFSGVLYGVVLAVLWQVLVILGLHWSVIPLAIMQIGMNNESQILTPTFAASFAQVAVVAAMYFKLNNKKLKQLTIPAIISGLCGVTEPAIYGLSLPKKKPFIYSMIGAGVGGFILMYFNVKTYVMGGLGVFGIVNFISHDGDGSKIPFAILAVAVAMVISFVLTYVFWNDVEESEEQVSTQDKVVTQEMILAPLSGKVLPLSEAKDEAFSSGVIGKGVVIEPNKGVVVAPFDGTVLSVFPTKHAIGLVSKNGVELLIHIGIDTVKMEGNVFKTLVSQGEMFKTGDKLVDFDLEAIEAAGYSTQTPVIVTNSSDFLDIVEHIGEDVSTKESIITTIV